MVAENFRRIVIGFFTGAAIAFASATPSVAAEPPNAANLSERPDDTGQ